MIGFYLNASERIGLGHYNRCLLIHKLIPKQSTFFTESQKLKKILSKNKINYYFVKKSRSLSALFFNKKIKILIIDLQYLNNNIKKFLKKNKKIFTVILADKHKKNKDVNLTIFPEITKYKKKGVFSGEKYVLVPKLSPKKKITKIINIMISMGGSDPHNITKKIVRLLLDINKKVKLNIVLGKFYKYKSSLIKHMLNTSSKYKIYNNQKNLRHLMFKNDLLSTNSGITKYEAFAMKLPTIIVSNSKEANLDQKIFSDLGGSVFIGDVHSKKLKNLRNVVLKLIDNKKIVREMQAACKNYFDGNGPKRLLNLIYSEYKKQFKLNK